MFHSKTTNKEDLVKKYHQGPLLSPGATTWSEPMREFFYSYDAFREARKALNYKDRLDGIPEGAIQHFGRNTSKRPNVREN